MPKATANVDSTERFDLKSCPGGFVVLKRMTYGQMLARREMIKLAVSSTKGSKDFQGELAMASSKTTRFEFQHCILDHNLEDASGRNLNLASPVDFDSLDPRIGQEIEKLISDMNNFNEDDDELGN
jgi:hypothetical protein